jgi:hypothetical protein
MEVLGLIHNSLCFDNIIFNQSENEVNFKLIFTQYTIPSTILIK